MSPDRLRSWGLLAQWSAAYVIGFLPAELALISMTPEVRDRPIFPIVNLQDVLAILFAVPTFLVLRFRLHVSWWYGVPWVLVTGIGFFAALVILERLAATSDFPTVAFIRFVFSAWPWSLSLVVGCLQSLLLYVGLRRKIPSYRLISSWRWILATVLGYVVGSWLYFKGPSPVVSPYFLLVCLGVFQGHVLGSLLIRWGRTE